MFMSRPHAFKRVTIVGVGLMGGSFGLALKKYQLASEVIGFSHRQSSLVNALKVKAIDEGHTDVAKAIRNSDLIVLATPVSTIVQLFATISPHLKRGCIVTDLGSTKVEIVEAAEKKLPNHVYFIGSHPMTGSEQTGVEFARAELFENAHCILTPTSKTSPVAKEKIKHLWTKMGAKIALLSPVEHDEILSYISHLPHLLAYGLMETIPQKFLEYATPGLKDTTRIASSSPQVWNDICIANSKNVIKALDECVKALSHLRKAIVAEDQKTLMQHFTKAKEKRDEIQPKAT